MLESIISLKHTISNAHTSAKSYKEDEAVLQQQKKDLPPQVEDDLPNQDKNDESSNEDLNIATLITTEQK